MIYVIATIELHPGARDQFLREFARLRPQVAAEDGCLEYGAAIHVDNGESKSAVYAWTPPREDAVVIVEKWASLTAWRAHLVAPHMDAYRERSKPFVTGRAVQVLAPAG